MKPSTTMLRERLAPVLFSDSSRIGTG